MKIGVSSYSFAKYMKDTGCNYLKICDLAKEIGYDGIEFIGLNPDVSGKDVFETAREIREHCAKIGLEIAAYTVSADFSVEDPAAEAQRVMGCVDVAEALGVQIMRHDTSKLLVQAGSRISYRETIAKIAPHIRAVAGYAQRKGIRTCTENHGYYMQDPHRVEELIRAVDHPNYGWLVDMGNFICADCDSIQAMAIAIPYAIHVHAKDFLFKKGSEMNPGAGWFQTRGKNHVRGTVVGHGVIPVYQCVQMLKAAGYEGYLSLEFEGMEDNLAALRAGHDYLRRCVE